MTPEYSVEPVYWSHIPILCVQLLWMNQKATQVPQIKSSFAQQTQLEANCNILVSLIEKKSLACQQMQTPMQRARSEQLYVSHFS